MKPSGLEELATYFEERAKGGVGLMITGGIAPNRRGRASPFASKLTYGWEAKRHRIVTDSVHKHNAKILVQILHTGRYAYHPFSVAPSSLKSPISYFTPSALTGPQVWSTIADYARCAALAREGGYDGVEIMGSEGYLINQFISSGTNKRTDEWGGEYQNRMKFPLEIIRAVRKSCGLDFIIVYRLSMIDLVKSGSTWDEIVQLAQAVEEAGATIINTGIGWHEARIPTIATMVPRSAFTWVTAKMRGMVKIPLVASNRINTPAMAERVLELGHADMVSMARPFLADPEFVQKAQQGREDEINTCIGCNQACLDHVFKGQRATCLVNPKAGYELQMKNSDQPPKEVKRIAVVGAGPAGLSFACQAAKRGHQVTLFEKDTEIGGQFNMAKTIPGKEEFHETLRYFKRQLELYKVTVHLNRPVTEADLTGYQAVVLASGVVPRPMTFEGVDKCLSYIDVLKHKKSVGKSVAIIGAGGIGFDVAEFLAHDDTAISSSSTDIPTFLKEWGIDETNSTRGGLAADTAMAKSHREIYLLQRKTTKPGKDLGKTTGWIHRQTLQQKGVQMITGVSYKKFVNGGLFIGLPDGSERELRVDDVILCAGQLPLTELLDAVKAKNGDATSVHVIGGSSEASELDAKKAISQGFRLACEI